MLDILKVILLGIVEGVTEWLPISSTGHMILVNEFIKLGVSEDFLEVFKVVIQSGAVMAVLVLYFHKLNPFSPRKSRKQKVVTIQLWMKIAVACLPAVVIGLLTNDWIEKALKGLVVIAITFILYGIVFIVVEIYNKGRIPKVEKLSRLTYRDAAIIGAFQVLALIPGTSRSGATIIGALIFGVSRYVATEFTFFVAIPMIFGASFLKIFKHGFNFTIMEVVFLLVGSLTAFFVSLFAIKFLIGYIKRNDFKIFGYYRIALGVLVLGYVLIFG